MSGREYFHKDFYKKKHVLKSHSHIPALDTLGIKYSYNMYSSEIKIIKAIYFKNE